MLSCCAEVLKLVLGVNIVIGNLQMFCGFMYMFHFLHLPCFKYHQIVVVVVFHV